MKSPREKKVNVDLLKPLDLSQFPIVEGNCFGVEWDPRDKDCSVCSDIDICGILFKNQTIKPSMSTFEKETGPSLDTASFSGVSWPKIVKLVDRYVGEGEPMTEEELYEAIQVMSNTKDMVAIKQYVERELAQTELIIIDGKLVRK